MENADMTPTHRERTSRRLPNDVALIILEARLRQGFSCRRAARRCGTSAGYMSMLERGLRCPSVVIAEALIDGLRLSSEQARRLREVALSGVGRDFKPLSVDNSY